MDCSNCGKDIPYSGKVCPYCNADKSEDQFFVTASWVGGLPGVILGFIAVKSLWGIPMALWGIPIGFVLGMIAIYVIREFLRSKGKKPLE